LCIPEWHSDNVYVSFHSGNRIFYCKTTARGKPPDLQETRPPWEQNPDHFQTVEYNPEHFIYCDSPEPIFGWDQNLVVRAHGN
jgi:hypothetical protein